MVMAFVFYINRNGVQCPHDDPQRREVEDRYELISNWCKDSDTPDNNSEVLYSKSAF